MPHVSSMPANLITSPHCHADQLGLPMPDDVHAVSACLPLWQHNIGYEEGDASVHDRLQAAYPRFCFHPLVNQLADRFLNSGNRRGLPFVSRRSAQRAADFVQHATGEVAELVAFDGHQACGVVVGSDQFKTLKQYWQHAGENVSSRVAQQLLAGHSTACSDTAVRTVVGERVAAFQNVEPNHVFLYPSGMAAVASAWRTVQALRPGSTCQFGFPYVDTLKIQQRFPASSHTFLPVGGPADLKLLEAQCEVQPPTAVICEAPTNPLLVTPDLRRLRDLADQHDFLLIVDDTLTACGNLNTTALADIAVTSLTKYFSGYGNVLAGAMTINPNGRHAARLLELVRSAFEETLSDVDVEVLANNSRDMPERVATINSNAAALADFLRSHASVQSVYYPSADDANYTAIQAANGGYGGLISIVLRKPETTTPPFFDGLEVCKGPNLGTNFTLCCPYTILAHYDELDFVETCGVSRWLLRISVGVEPIGELRSRFERALNGIMLHT